MSAAQFRTDIPVPHARRVRAPSSWLYQMAVGESRMINESEAKSLRACTSRMKKISKGEFVFTVQPTRDGFAVWRLKPEKARGKS